MVHKRLLRKLHLAHDPTAHVVCHKPDDRFIPVRASDLTHAVCEDRERFGEEVRELRSVAAALCDVIDQEARGFSHALADQYARFNPDRDTMLLDKLDEHAREAQYRLLRRRLLYLFDKANFEQMSDVEIEEAVRAANSQGLRVRLREDMVDELTIWVRGQATTSQRFRTWRHPLRGERRKLPVYRRLVVMARLKDDPNVVLKLFKDLPIADIEALLPHAEVRMNWFDRIKVFGGGAGAAGSTAAKLFKLAAGLVYWSRITWILLAAFVMIAARSILGYRSTRKMRDSLRTQHLYFQNLDNNSGVVQSLIAMIAQEEFKEALLAYAFCRYKADDVLSEDDLASQVNAYLKERFKVSVQFDAADAVETMERLNLWEDAATLKTMPPGETVEQLGQHWQKRASRLYHEEMACGADVDEALEDVAKAAPEEEDESS
jgi:Protein of unknown function (DUF3754)